jgi:hypothetical protein
MLCLLACLLTVAASGDDFSLVRVVLPSALPASEALPLDDPNNDFLTASPDRARQETQEHTGDDQSLGGVRQEFGFATVSASLGEAAPLGDQHFQRTELSFPLLC